ncbi:DUF4843 domain-containing protein [Carboxylicivirga marina]|uniref:DUF4843 domain-containing protein n=1 Tax=Carboxylicivirga marina TaxID=2800988 RepID=A0ABS1HHN7_9BACT|nr:DUF4843 domain-containing protein [Carboxylicivirga marina]MBK3516990.1 DUF4843 domain-containing protein [Carboxylicivirga marina]
MKILFKYLPAFAFIIFCACQESERMLFNSQAAIYFNVSDNPGEEESDSLIYSFAKGFKQSDTVHVNVKIIGETTNYDRYFKVSVDESLTTAVEGVDFNELAGQYKLPANSFTGFVSLVLNNSLKLQEQSVCVGLRVEESVDFKIGLQEKLTARIIFSDFLMKSPIWDIWLKYYFGTYSRVKHRVFLELFNIDVPQSMSEMTEDGLWRSYGTILNNYFKENYPVYDEKGSVIEPWQ